jgi:cysteinyl-tRNA synthetase
MIAGARVEVAPFKEDPMDFVLWKPSSEEEPGWASPWGRGRPGWHIECSAMSYELLGPSFDIHGGGLDLQFPHHENEIAQSCCAHPDAGFAKVWMHNEMLQVEGKKMSKSLGNFFTVRDLLDQRIPGEVIRFVYLSTHYRKPMDWTAEKARDAEGTLRKWRGLLTGIMPSQPKKEFTQDLADDLNTSKALYWLHHMADDLGHQRHLEGHAVGNLTKKSEALEAEFVASANLVGLLLPELGSWLACEANLTPYAERLTALRAEAMVTKNFAPVDALKAALTAAGVEVRMSKAGVELLPGPGFDPAKLEAIK